MGASRFFSAALEAAQKIGQKSGTGQQLKSMLRTYGSKPKELAYIGVDDAFKDDQKYQTSELLDYIDQHQVKPSEVVHKGEGLSAEDEHRMNLIADAMIRANSANEDEAKTAVREFEALTGTAWSQGSAYEGYAPVYELQHITPERVAEGVGTDDPAQDREWDEAFATASELFGSNAKTRWSQYTSEPASDKYTEHLVTLPPPLGWTSASPKHAFSEAYQSPHWDEPNVLAHMRYDFEPKVPGAPGTLRLEEIQSDWLQKAREKGFRPGDDEFRAMHQKEIQELLARGELIKDISKRTPGFQFEDVESTGFGGLRHGLDMYQSMSLADRIAFTEARNRVTDVRNAISTARQAPPRAPLANVNDWTAMMLRRAMLEAAERDTPRLSWTGGALQDRRYSPEPGRAKFYDEIIPNIARSLVKPYTADPRVVSRYWDEGVRNVQGPRKGADFHYLDLPPELIQALQKKGKVPFFKDGGRV